MRTYLITLFVFTALFFSLNRNGLMAQEFDQRPEFPLTGSWYAPPADCNSGASRTTDPYIVSCISQVNADSMRATLVHLQNYGTRFMLAGNRKEVAEWILGKFQSFGYTDVRLDSFLNYINWGGGVFVDTTWQYNVICTLPGASAPAEEYLIGGHYDSYCSGDPMVYAPGVNDNGTAVAATLEVARIMAKENYHPEVTVKFALFAAEELGLWGSRYQAEKARSTGEDVRYYLNLDMISNNPDSTDQVKVYRYLYFEWAGNLMADVFSRYTNLQVYIPGQQVATGSDSFSYWLFGFPTAYLEEFDFSPNWHQPDDVIENCNVEYCAEITRGAMATLMEQEKMPYPQGLAAQSSKDGIRLTWRPEQNANVAGANVYRAENLQGIFTRMNDHPVADSFFLDASVTAGKEFIYKITFTNDSLQESIYSGTVSGARFGFTDTLLVVACLKGNKTTPDSVIAFYGAVLDTIPHKWVDMNLSNPLDLGLLATSQNVLWLINSLEFDLPTDTLGLKLLAFFENGGNMMFAGFTPSKYLAGNMSYPSKFPEEFFINRYFKVDSVNRKIGSFMYRAYPDEGGYDTLRVDPGKWMEPTFPGEIYNIEVFTPAPGGASIYRFDSHYPATSTQGAMQGKTVGLEYMGEENRTILLSFPLWYLDTSDARKLMKYVMNEKFTHPTGIAPVRGNPGIALLQNYPNPVYDNTILAFSLDQPVAVKLFLFDMQGAVVRKIIDRKMEKGMHTVPFSRGNLPSGIYHVVLETSLGSTAKKLVLIR